MRESKFLDLELFLKNSNQDYIELTFTRIEDILGFKLEDSAYMHRPYWYPSKTHYLPKAWLEAGYKMDKLDLKGQRVCFIKGGSINATIKIAEPKSIHSHNLLRNIAKPKIDIDVIIDKANEFYNSLNSDENSRYLSWEHCYKVFQEAYNKGALTDEDIDYLSLHLAFYLASWGMLRGSSFLLQKDYRVHIDIVKEIFKPCYNNLWRIDYVDLQKQQNLDVLIDLINKMRTLYREKRKNIKEVGTDISDILITKVLLGTLGCVPAYDEYFKKGIAKYNISTQLLGKYSVKGLAEFYDGNKTELESVRKSISQNRQMEYPQMKILDMAFWQLGFDNK